MTDKELKQVQELTLWGMGPYAVSRHRDDPEGVINNLVWRLGQIRQIVENHRIEHS